MADTAVPATTLGPSAPAAPPNPPAPQKLDDLMLAMDVVDTLRHQDNLVARELDETRREAQLIERLRQIYRDQGIEVPDRVLHEGVRALKESRFVYTLPSPGLARTLALAWVHRGRTGKALLGLLVTAVIGWGAYQVGVVRPAQQRTEQVRAQTEREQRELTDLLPRALEQAIRRFWRRRRRMTRGSEPTTFSPTAAPRSRAGTRPARRRPSATWTNYAPTCGANTGCASSPARASRAASGASRPATRAPAITIS